MLQASPAFDDGETKIPAATQELLNTTFTTYYKNPSVAKVNTILDIINGDEVLRKKTAWPVFVGFLTVVFADNKNHVISWITRNDYNTYAEDVMMSALLHAKLKETAVVFAQAQQWKKEDVDHVHEIEDDTDLKHQKIILPGHIDTLWGAFFASGDEIYLNEIINVLFMTSLPKSKTVYAYGHKPEDVLAENKKTGEKQP